MFDTLPKLLFNDKKLVKARDFRNVITGLKYSKPCSVQFWSHKFDIDLDQTVWTVAKHVTSESRLRELHWKLLHNIYPTNTLLKKIGLAAEDKCPYCTDELDYIEHFFFYCRKVNRLWNYVETLILVRYGTRILLKATDVLTGVRNEDGNTRNLYRFLNHLILIGKMTVSKFRYGTPLDIIIMFEKELVLRNLL